MSQENRSGRKPRVSDDELLEVFRGADEPVLTTTDVADAIPIGKRATLDRLKALHEAGVLEQKSVGPRGQVWWLPAETAGGIPAGDPFFDAPTFAVTEPVDETAIDDVVYGEAGGNQGSS